MPKRRNLEFDDHKLTDQDIAMINKIREVHSYGKLITQEMYDMTRNGVESPSMKLLKLAEDDMNRAFILLEAAIRRRSAAYPPNNKDPL